MSSPHFSIFPRTVAILLAAGASRRMGMSKPLLRIGGRSLAAQLTSVLLTGGAEMVMLVTTREREPVLRSAIPDSLRDEAVLIVVNDHPEAGMLSSVQVGLRAIPPESTDALLVCPCDLPLLTPGSVYAILHYWTGKCGRDRGAIIAPAYAGKRGHPTLFGANFYPVIGEMDSRQVGLNTLLKQRAEHVREIAADDQGVVADADTPEEWENLVGMPPVCWPDGGDA